MTAKKITALAALLVYLWILPPIYCQDVVISRTGDILLFTMPAAALGSTLVIGDSKGTLQFTKGFLLNQAITNGLKIAINKDRPYDGGDHAFPSGHTSTTFQAASFIQRRYGWKYGIPAYALSGFTAFSRVHAKRHDVYDCIAGAVIGIGSSYLFTTPYLEEHLELTYTSGDDYFLIGFKYTID